MYSYTILRAVSLSKINTLVLLLISFNFFSESNASQTTPTSEITKNLVQKTNIYEQSELAASITKWTEKSLALRQDYKSAPLKAYQQILRAENQYVSLTEQAEYFLLLSEASANLNLFNQTRDYSISGLSLIDVHSQPWLYHHLRLYEAQAFDQLGNTTRGIDYTEAAKIWALENGAYELLVLAHKTRGLQHLTLGQNDNAISNFQMAFDLSEQHGYSFSIDDLAYLTGYVYEYTRQDAQAYNEYKKVHDRIARGNNEVLLTKVIYGMGRAVKNLGALEKGAELLTAAAKKANDIGLTQYSAFAHKELSGYFLTKKQPDDAVRVLEIAKTLFEESENPYMLMDVNFTLGRVGLQTGNAQMAESYLIKAQEYIQSDTMRPHQLALDYAVVELLTLKGETEEALAQMKALYKDYRQYTQNQNIKELYKLTTFHQLKSSENQNTYLEQKTQVQQQRLEQQTQNYFYASTAVSVVILSLLALYLNSRKHSRLLQKLNNTDALTQLSSRRYIMDRLSHEIDVAKRHKQALTIASIDLDHFKKINDTYGHDVGDKVLSRFGLLCKEHFRNTDLLGRVGGEEFLFCFTHTQKSEALKAVKALNEKVKKDPVIYVSAHGTVTLSAGVIEVDTSKTLNENLVGVDRCLYRAKANGRDQVCVG